MNKRRRADPNTHNIIKLAKQVFIIANWEDSVNGKQRLTHISEHLAFNALKLAFNNQAHHIDYSSLYRWG